MIIIILGCSTVFPNPNPFVSRLVVTQFVINSNKKIKNPNLNFLEFNTVEKIYTDVYTISDVARGLSLTENKKKVTSNEYLLFTTH